MKRRHEQSPSFIPSDRHSLLSGFFLKLKKEKCLIENQDYTQNQNKNGQTLEFIDIETVKWTKNDHVLFVLDQAAPSGKPYAFSLSPKYLRKVLNRDEAH